MARDSQPACRKGDKYLSKRLLNRAVRKGVMEAAENAVKTADFLVLMEGDWLVKRYKNGQIEKIRKLERTSTAEIERKLAKLASV